MLSRLYAHGNFLDPARQLRLPPSLFMMSTYMPIFLSAISHHPSTLFPPDLSSSTQQNTLPKPNVALL
jgi:hypothetical protein